MDFAFDESTEAYRRAVRDFATARLAPHYQDGDRTGRARPQLTAELAQIGLLGLRVPAEAGGQGADAVTTGVALEEVARADFNAAYVVLLCALVADILGAASAPAAALEAVASGAALPCLALTEPGHGRL
ncbi:MAG TPA: acyl-CoA dehydrogenase family protein [Solirubrobacteraceae bacterium]|nr:acyl-CoA dehydrogenase family protein [Solirubrobacteraceae bacterium]